MHISHAENGALRVLLSDADLKRFGTDFEALKEHDPQTNTAIRRILRVVFAKTALPRETSMTVEAIPVDEGCLLLITPRLQTAENICAVATANEDALLQLNEALQKAAPDGIINAVLYRLDNLFYLVLFCEQITETFCAFLHEFGCVHTGNTAAAYMAEFGTPLL